MHVCAVYVCLCIRFYLRACAARAARECMCVDVFALVHMFTSVYVGGRGHIYTRTHTGTHARTHTRARAHVRTHAHTHCVGVSGWVYESGRPCVCPCVRPRVHASMHVQYNIKPVY